MELRRLSVISCVVLRIDFPYSVVVFDFRCSILLQFFTFTLANLTPEKIRFVKNCVKEYLAALS